MLSVLYSTLGSVASAAHACLKQERKSSQFYYRPKFLLAPEASELVAPQFFKIPSEPPAIRALASHFTYKAVIDGPVHTVTGYWSTRSVSSSAASELSFQASSVAPTIVQKAALKLPSEPKSVTRVDSIASLTRSIQKASDVRMDAMHYSSYAKNSSPIPLLSHTANRDHYSKLASPLESPHLFIFRRLTHPLRQIEQDVNRVQNRGGEYSSILSSPHDKANGVSLSTSPPSLASDSRSSLSAIIPLAEGGDDIPVYPRRLTSIPDYLPSATSGKPLQNPFLASWLVDYLFLVITRNSAAIWTSDVRSHPSFETRSKAIVFVNDFLLTFHPNDSVVFLALLYIRRLIPMGFIDTRDRNKPLRLANVIFRLFLTGVMLADKWLEDYSYDSKQWASFADLPCDYVRSLEFLALRGMQFDIGTRSDEWHTWMNLLREYHASLYPLQSVNSWNGFFYVGELLGVKLDGKQRYATVLEAHDAISWHMKPQSVLNGIHIIQSSLHALNPFHLKLVEGLDIVHGFFVPIPDSESDEIVPRPQRPIYVAPGSDSARIAADAISRILAIAMTCLPKSESSNLPYEHTETAYTNQRPPGTPPPWSRLYQPMHEYPLYGR